MEEGDSAEAATTNVVSGSFARRSGAAVIRARVVCPKMIHHTITIVAITAMHLALVTFTMDIYRTDAAAWSQTETTNDRKGNFIRTAYQQMVSTNISESFNNSANTYHDELKISLENLVSAVNISNYVGCCSDLLNHTDKDEIKSISYGSEFTQELIKTAREMYDEFNTLIKSALSFICTGNTTLGYDVITMSRIYFHNFTDLNFGLKGSAAAIGEVAVLDTVTDLYRTSIQQVECVKEIVEHLTEMISEREEIDALNRSILQQTEEARLPIQSSVWETIVGEQTILVNLLKNIFKKVVNMTEHKDGNPFINIITSSTISRFHDAQYWEELLKQETEILVTYQTWLLEAQHTHFTRYTLTPVIITIVLLVGITGNGLLLTIFVRHKETWTLPNSMLINLTVVDLISLVVNVLLWNLRLIMVWRLGWFGCKLFVFFSYLTDAVSIYSVVMISFQRFVAVWQLPSLAWYHQSHKTKYVLIGTVWGLGSIVSVPYAVLADIDSDTEICYGEPFDYYVYTVTAELILFCVMPLLITAVFSGLTAYRIRRSVGEIPGEATAQRQLKRSRIVSSTVLIAMTVLFVFSYVPDFLFNFLVFVVDISITLSEYNFVTTITSHLQFVNCCLNPIFLIVMCKRFRRYIKGYCGQRGVQPATRAEAV